MGRGREIAIERLAVVRVPERGASAVGVEGFSAAVLSDEGFMVRPGLRGFNFSAAIARSSLDVVSLSKRAEMPVWLRLFTARRNQDYLYLKQILFLISI